MTLEAGTWKWYNSPLLPRLSRALSLDVKAEMPKEPNAKLFLLHL